MTNPIFFLVCTVCNFTFMYTGNECKTSVETYSDKPALIERLKREPTSLSGPQCRVIEGRELFYSVKTETKQVERTVIDNVEVERKVELRP